MPIFYHYTCRDNIEGIFHDRAIRPGAAASGPEGVRPNHAVCLTTDKDPSGHGLPDGREIAMWQAEILGKYSRSGDKLFSVDHTKYRIGIEIEKSDKNLVYVPPLFESQPLMLESMEIAGYALCSKDLSNKELLENLGLLRQGTIKGKSKTWWYYRDSIPFEWIIEVAIKMQPDNTFRSVTAPQFEKLLAESPHKRPTHLG